MHVGTACGRLARHATAAERGGRVVEALVWRGGVLDAALLHHLTSRRRVRTALRRGEVVRVTRGRYALPDADVARLAARGCPASCRTWAPRSWPARGARTAAAPAGRDRAPQPQGGAVAPGRGRGQVARPHRGRGVARAHATAGRTVVDCAKDLPFDEALTVADSALRHGNVTTGRALRLAEQVPSTGRAAVPARRRARQLARREPVRVGAAGDLARRRGPRPASRRW